MKVSWAIPVIVSILIFSGFSVTQQTFAATVNCNILLDTAQEVPVPNVTGFTPSGSTSLVVDTITGGVTITGSYTGMTSNVVGSHLHGLAPPGVATGIIFGLTNTGGTAGTFSGASTLSAANLAGLLAGQTYINVHTANNASGEIRGQVICPAAMNLIGGTSIPIDTTALLVAGFNANSIWMIPTVLGLAGAGIVIFKLKRK